MVATKAKYQELDSRDIVAEFFPRFEAAVGGGWAALIAFMVDSDRETEDYKWPGATGGLKEWKGDRDIDNPRKFDFTIKNAKFEDTMGIPLEDLRRDKTGMLRARVGEMAMKAAQHWQKLLSLTIETNPVGYDGQNIYSVTHDESGVNQLNILGVGEVPSSNVADVALPTPEEASAFLLEMIGHQYTFTDDKKEPTNGEAQSFIFMVRSPAYWGAIASAISSTNLAGGQSNVLKAANLNLNLSVVLNPRLTASSDNKVRSFRTDGLLKSWIMQDEEPVTTQLLAEGSDHEFKEDEHLFGVKATRATGPGEWKHTQELTLT